MGEKQDGKETLLANGHAKVDATLEKLEAEIVEEENIFLFIPNLIGVSETLCAKRLSACSLS